MSADYGIKKKKTHPKKKWLKVRLSLLLFSIFRQRLTITLLVTSFLQACGLYQDRVHRKQPTWNDYVRLQCRAHRAKPNLWEVSTSSALICVISFSSCHRINATCLLLCLPYIERRYRFVRSKQQELTYKCIQKRTWNDCIFKGTLKVATHLFALACTNVLIRVES